MSQWLNGSPQQQQPNQLAALAQHLGIDPALMGALGGGGGPTRAQMLGQLGAAITNNNQYGRNAITSGLADFTQMQGMQGQQGDPMQRLAQILELQGMLDTRRSADAKSKRLAKIQERIDSGAKFSEAEIANLALEFPESQNVWQQMLKDLQGPKGLPADKWKEEQYRARALGVEVPGMEHITPETAKAWLESELADSTATAGAGATQIMLPGEKKLTDTLGRDGAEALSAWQAQAQALTEVAANAREYADTLDGLDPQLDAVTGMAEVASTIPGVNRIVNPEELGRRQSARAFAGEISLAKAQLIKGALSDSDRKWINSLGPQSTWSDATRKNYAAFNDQLARATNAAVAETEAELAAGAIAPTQVGSRVRQKILELRLAERNGFVQPGADSNGKPAAGPAGSNSAIPAHIVAEAAGLPEGQRFEDEETDVVYVIRNGKPVRE